MKRTSATIAHRPLAALGAGAALLIALTGCQPGAKDAAPAPATTQAAPSTATSTPQDGGGSAMYSAPATTAADSGATPTDGAAAGAAAGTPGKLTPPGTALKLGAVATTHSNSGDKGTAKYKEATYDMAVTKIVAGTNADLAKFKDSAKFAGQTPYYVFANLTLTSLNRPSAGLSDPRVTGLLKDGSEAQKLIVFGSIADCKDSSFTTKGEDDAFSFVVGSDKTTCSVFLAPAGDAITSVSYDDSSFNYPHYDDNKYSDNPITWGK